MSLTTATVDTIYNVWCNDYSPQDTEIGLGDLMVDAAGYVDKQTQITQLLNAGNDLIAYKEEMYPDSNNPVDGDGNPLFDPTVQYGYDFFQAHADTVFVNQNLEESMRTQNSARIITEPDTPATLTTAGSAATSPPVVPPVLPPQTS